MKRFSAAVIGLGRIGQGYDYDRSADGYILTHAAGFAAHEGYELVAGVDPDGRQRERFEQKFRRPTFDDVESLLRRCRPDVVAIAVPTRLHYQMFETIVRGRPRAVICEKPMTARVQDARRMVALAEDSGCALLVNYVRRFDPGVLTLRRVIQQGELGEIYKGTVWYTKGWLVNASHFVDLLMFLLGGAKEITILDPGPRPAGDDPEPDVRIGFKDATVYFLCGREEFASMAELELIGTRARVRYERGGATIRVQRAQPDSLFPGYRTFGTVAETVPSDMNRYQWQVLESLHRHLTDGTELNADGRSSVETLEVIERVLALL
jgi:predicted dehydrogenase